jgi:hypothetical protein
MPNIRTIAAWAALLFAPAVIAKPLAGQSRSCNAHQKCDSGLQCVAHHGGNSTCELVCAANAKCPEDQRCVKDASLMVCRPINDGVGL